MLVVSRKLDEVIVIGDSIKVTVIAISGGRVRLGVEAPRDVSVDRKEVRDQKDLARDFENSRRVD